MSAAPTTWSVTAVRLGTLMVPESAVRTPSQEAIWPAPLTMFVLQAGDEVVLVDCGSHAAGTPGAAQHKYDLVQGKNELPLAALALLGIAAEDVTHVVLTHLHWDHCANVGLFPAAAVHFHERELVASFQPPAGQDRAYEAPTIGLTPPWVGASGRVRVIGAEGELLPGIRILHTPGHTPGSISLEVRTSEGPLILAGDLVAVSSELDGAVLPGLIADEREATESLLRLRALGVRVLPSHDPGLFEGADGPIQNIVS
jgi:N-acyl homoserine lactone hydrolase